MLKTYSSQEIVDYCVEAFHSKRLTVYELAMLFDVRGSTIYRWVNGEARTDFVPNRSLNFCLDAAKLDQDECVIWPYSKNQEGYGNVKRNGRTDKAHRVVCELVRGEAPSKGLFVLHSCDNPSCVNPRHLRFGTAQENAIERNEKGRANSTRGHARRERVLTEVMVREILKVAKPGNFKQLGKLYGVDCTTIGAIYHRKTWRWVTVT